MSGVLQVLRDILREHEWDFENALGSLLLFSSESGKIKKKKHCKILACKSYSTKTYKSDSMHND